MREEKEESFLTLHPSRLARVASSATTAAKHGQVTDSGSPQAKHEQTTHHRGKEPTKQPLQGCWIVARTLIPEEALP